MAKGTTAAELRGLSRSELDRRVGELKEELFGLRFSNVMDVGDYARFADFQDDATLRKWNLWGYIDARDVGTAYRAALEGTSTGHEVCLIAASDTRARRGLRELMADFYDGYGGVAADHDDHASAFDCTRMRTLFGWTPSHSWRDVLDAS